VALMRGSKVETDFGLIQRKHLTVTGSTLRSRSVEQKAAIIAALKDKVWPLWAAGELRPFTYKQFPLIDAAWAHRLMESITYPAFPGRYRILGCNGPDYRIGYNILYEIERGGDGRPGG